MRGHGIRTIVCALGALWALPAAAQSNTPVRVGVVLLDSMSLTNSAPLDFGAIIPGMRKLLAIHGSAPALCLLIAKSTRRYCCLHLEERQLAGIFSLPSA